MDEQIRQPATPLDRFDRAILDLLQEDSSQPHRAIAEQVHLSTSSVRRRIEAMKADGTILREVALVDPARYGLAFLTFVSFGEESPAAYDAFREQMRADAAVSQCHSVSGDHDFVLMVHAVSPAAYEQWERPRSWPIPPSAAIQPRSCGAVPSSRPGSRPRANEPSALDRGDGIA